MRRASLLRHQQTGQFCDSVVPHTEDVERLVVSIAESCEKWLAKQGYGEEAETQGEDDAQAVIQAAALAGKAALGARAGKRARRIQVLGGREVELPPRVYAASAVREVAAGASSGRKPGDDAEAKMERWNDRNRIFTYGICGAPRGDPSSAGKKLHSHWCSE